MPWWWCGRRARKPAVAPVERIIVIDPGHGGVDPGAIGSATKLLEKQVALRMGLALRARLEATGRYKVVMTRADDRIVRLRDRLQIARQSRGELFISLHADSLMRAPAVNGASVYTLSERASNDEAARLARKENCADILAGVDLSDQEDIVTEILIDLAQRDANNKSVRLAEGAGQGAESQRPRWPSDGARRPASSCSNRPTCPRCWSELGYLSNRADEKTLRDPAHLARLAKAMLAAIDQYFAPRRP